MQLQIRDVSEICFSYFTVNIYYGYSLEVSHRGTSNKYLQIIFSGRSKKNQYLFVEKKVSYLELCKDVKNQGINTINFIKK